MTRLGSSMIPGLLAKSWYVTMCSINFSGSNNITYGFIPPGEPELLHVPVHTADTEHRLTLTYL